MKKLWILYMSTSLLAACYCNCKSPLPATQEPTPSAQTQEILPQENSSAQKPAVVSTEPVVATPLSTPKSTTQMVAKPTQTTKQPEKSDTSAAFTVQQADALIQTKRAHQSLTTPASDAPKFKNEEILPTSGRLFNPLAYEPVHPDTTHAPWSNESLKYGIYYSFIKAGTAYIKTRGITEYNGHKAYFIQTTAFSASAIDAVFKVRDINYSWLDTNTLHSLGYSQSLREGNYVRDEWISFEPENHRFYGEMKKKKGKETIVGKLNQEVQDMLTSLYYVRSHPLQVGQDVTFDIVNRGQQYPLVVKVLGKETVKTSAGKFNCLVVEPQFRGEGIFVAKGKSLKVWLTDDKYRMPVKMSVEVFIGSVYAELLEYKRN